MKRNRLLLIALPVLIPGQVLAQAAIENQPEESSMSLTILLVLCLLLLVLLTLWLFKNSSRLAETLENSETSGKVWLNSHLKDLDNHQLDILIKRHQLMSNPSLNDEKPNEE